MSQETDQLIHQGKAFVKHKDITSALSCFTQAIQLEPENSQAYCMRGLTHLHFTRDMDCAAADLTTALTIQPDMVDAYLARGQAFRNLGKMPQATADFKQFLQAKPDHPQAGDLRAYIEQSQKLAASPTTTNPAVQHWLDQAEAQILIGYPANIDEAVTCFSKAIEIDPTNVQAYRRRAFCRTMNRQFDLCLEDYTQIIKLCPSDAMAYGERARLYLEKRELKHAWENIQQALTLQPNSARYYRLLGQILIEQGDDRRGAITAFTQAIQLGEQDARLLRGKAIMQKKIETEDEIAMVKEDFGWVLAQKPDHPESAMMREGLKEAAKVETRLRRRWKF